MHLPPPRLSYLVWGLAAAFYLFGFFQRVTPASLAGDLMRDFDLTAAALGNLSAVYFYAYAAIQIPTGILVDRIGSARLILAGALVSGIGAMLFALADGVVLAAVGRGLIGFAHGIAWVSTLKLISHWFAAERFATITGLSLAVGTLGAVLAGPPLRWLADLYGWRVVIAASGALVLVLAAAIRWRVRDDPVDRGFTSFAPPATRPRGTLSSAPRGAILRDIVEVFSHRNTALILFVNSGIGGAFLAFTGLWGVPFFTQQRGLSVQQATWITSTMLVLFALGGPVLGHLSDRWKLRKRPFATGAGAVVAGFGVLALWPLAPVWLLVVLLVVAGFGAGSTALSFGYAKESVPTQLQGTVTGVVNCGLMLGTLTQMPVIGLILDAHWRGDLRDGVRQYDLAAFQLGLLFLAGWAALSYLLLLATRETNARQLK